MSGSKEGGKKAAETIIKRYGEDHFINMGRKGGQKKGVKKGFAANPELASKAGRKGGTISKRGKSNGESR